jgi:hypothetical protein
VKVHGTPRNQNDSSGIVGELDFGATPALSG